MHSSSPSISVRTTTEADLDASVDLIAAVAAEGCWIATEAPIDHAYRRQRLLQQLARDDTQSFVAIGDDHIVGQLGVSVRWPGVLELGMLVATQWRGRGIGSALLSACIGWGREIGAHKIMLEVFPANLAALALYRKFGFVEEGYFRRHLRRKNGELWDVIAMSLSLEDRAPVTAEEERGPGEGSCAASRIRREAQALGATVDPPDGRRSRPRAFGGGIVACSPRLRQ